MSACPACAAEQIVEGRLLPSGDDGWVTYFYPKGLKFFAISRSVSLKDGQIFSACTSCGHVWSNVDPEELRELLAKSSK
jgi:hypothetical protein